MYASQMGTKDQIRIACEVCSETRSKSTEPCVTVTRKGDWVVWLCHHCADAGSAPIKERPKQKEKIVFAVEITSKLDAEPAEYLKIRGISEDVCTRAKLFGCERTFRTGIQKTIGFPNIIDGLVVGVKYRGLNKEFSQEANSKQALWGQQFAFAPTLVITEGEIDALSAVQCGLSAVSVPSGAPLRVSDGKVDPSEDRKFGFVWEAKDLLSGMTKIILATDNDEPGLALREELARRINKSKCWTVTYPDGCKDLNDVLVRHGEDEVRKVINNAQPYPINGLFGADEYFDAVDDKYLNGDGKGTSTGYHNIDEIYTVAPGQLTVVTGWPSSGKALALDTKIPTLNGWKVMSDIQVGDVVFDEDGSPCNVIAVTEPMLGHVCYKVKFDDGAEVIADEDHQWFTRTRIHDKSLINTSIKRGDRDYCIKNGNDQRWKTRGDGVITTKEISETLFSGDRFNHRIHVSGAVQWQKKELPIPPYTLGAWLGDGTSLSGQITSADIEIVDRIRADGFTVNKQAHEYGWGIIDLKVKLREINVLGNKHIPSVYMESSVDDRMNLIRGLMDTDGYCSANGSLEFCVTNKVLAHQVHRLLISVGIKCNIKSSDAKLYGVLCGTRYRIHFSTNLPVFHLDRKLNRLPRNLHNRVVNRYIVSCERVDSVPVKCISVDGDNHLFLCTENFIATHNSNFVDQVTVNLAREKDWRFLMASFENPPEDHVIKLCEIFLKKPFFAGPQPRMTLAELKVAKDWVNDHYIFLDVAKGGTGLESILQRAQGAVERIGIRGLVIDPYNYIEVERTGTEHENINHMLTRVNGFSKANDVHCWFVAHPAKMQREGADLPVPDGMSISGSMAWWSKCDVGITVHRQTDDVMIKVWKSRWRWIGKLGKAFLNYDVPTGSYYIV